MFAYIEIFRQKLGHDRDKSQQILTNLYKSSKHDRPKQSYKHYQDIMPKFIFIITVRTNNPVIIEKQPPRHDRAIIINNLNLSKREAIWHPYSVQSFSLCFL